MADPPRFELEQVSVAGIDGAWRLRDVSAHISDDGITALVGPSGSGKSTLLRCLNRLEVPAQGVVRYRGRDVATIDPLELRRQVGMVFQRPTPFPGSCRDNLRTARPDLTDAEAISLLDRVRLDASFLEREATQLSGGEAQRLCLARSLSVAPDVVLMDEVTSSLDPPARLALERLTRDFARDGVGVVWVTHDMLQVDRLADRVIVVVAGRVVTGIDAEAFIEESRRGE